MYYLRQDQALRLAQLSVITAGVKDRATLQHVELSFRKDEIVAVATDAFRLAIYVFDVLDDQPDVREQITIRVPGKQLADTIKAAYKMMPKAKDTDTRISLLPYHDDDDGTDNLNIAGMWGTQTPEFFVTDTLQGAKWVNWLPIMNGHPIDATDYPRVARVPQDMTLPAFAGSYLADISKLLGPTVVTRRPMEPVQLVSIAPDGSTDKGRRRPWAFLASTPGSSLVYVQMPKVPVRG